MYALVTALCVLPLKRKPNQTKKPKQNQNTKETDISFSSAMIIYTCI